MTYKELAEKYHSEGFSVIPLMPKGKKPLIKWEEYQKRRPTLEEIQKWWGDNPTANIGLITGKISNLTVLDIDKDLTREELNKHLEGLGLAKGKIIKTGKGWHIYLKHPGTEVPNGVRIADFTDFRGDGGYVVGALSEHENGKIYETVQEGDGYLDIPQQILDQLSGPKRKDWIDIGEIIKDGERNNQMARIAGRYFRKGLKEDEVLTMLKGVNLSRCENMLPNKELLEIVRSIGQKESKSIEKKKTKLEETKALFGDYLHLEDTDLLDIVFASIIANRWKADPLWLMIVAPPSSAKTEILRSFEQVEDTYFLSDLTENTFLSGMKRGKNQPDPSLLPKLTDKILILKDFTTLLTMYREKRAAIMAQLREIYDGSYTKDVGTGERKKWKGHIGLIAGVTPIIDSYSSANTLLGERFIFYRPNISSHLLVGKKVWANLKGDTKTREILSQSVKTLCEGLPKKRLENIPIREELKEKVINACRILTIMRCGVQRDPYTKAIESIPEPEGIARVMKQMLLLARALVELKDSEEVGEDEYRIMAKIVRHNIPLIRLKILTLLANSEKTVILTTRKIADTINVPVSTTRFHLEDLLMLKMVKRDLMGQQQEKEAFGYRQDDMHTPYTWGMENDVKNDLHDTQIINKSDLFSEITTLNVPPKPTFPKISIENDLIL